MLKKEEAISVWFIDKGPTHDWQPSTFRLDANLLKKDFSEAASTQLLGRPRLDWSIISSLVPSCL